MATKRTDCGFIGFPLKADAFQFRLELDCQSRVSRDPQREYTTAYHCLLWPWRASRATLRCLCFPGRPLHGTPCVHASPLRLVALTARTQDANVQLEATVLQAYALHLLGPQPLCTGVQGWGSSGVVVAQRQLIHQIGQSTLDAPVHGNERCGDTIHGLDVSQLLVHSGMAANLGCSTLWVVSAAVQQKSNMCASVGDDEECENSSFRIFWYITGSTATGLIDHHWHR